MRQDINADMTEAEPTEAAETSAIPVSLVDGTPAPGDQITLQVVSVDENAGTITVSKAAAREPMSGSDQLAAEFEAEPEKT